MTAISATHLPVLLDETLSYWMGDPHGKYIDGTFGRGGHTRALLACLSDRGQVLGMDKDPQAVQAGQVLAGQDPRFSIVQSPFSAIRKEAEKRHWFGQVDGILLDIGVSSPQLDNAERGFSFQQDGPLDMRMNPEEGCSAAQWLATASAEEIQKVLKTLGEERFARRIAQAIVETRLHTPIIRTRQLAELVEATIPFREKHKHPATRTFQAIRIYINQELEELKQGLKEAIACLAVGGRLAVITFHSLEDRIVKRYFRDEARGDDLPPDFPIRADELHPKIKLLSKAIKASEEELARNPRARSAILRVVEKQR